jgi:hypothetical protein
MSKHPTFTPIKSSMMKGYHYDPASRVLTVQFHGGSPYAYADVPAERVAAMTGGKSAGSYFAACIKPQHAPTKL